MAGVAIDTMSLPIGANPDKDRSVGYDELGRVVKISDFGDKYVIEIQPPQQKHSAVKSAVRALLDDPSGAVKQTLKGMIDGTWQAVSVPGRALAGETVTNGDALSTAATMFGAGAGMAAPEGALRSGAMRTSMTEAQTTAQKVLDMLKNGEGAQVTDEMMAAADPQYLYTHYDLPMDAASRVDRAKGMGFQIKTPSPQNGKGASLGPASSAFQPTPYGDKAIFHATDADVNAFDNAYLGRNTAANATDYADGSFAKNLATLGHWTSDRPLAGELVASVDMPLTARGNMATAPSLNALDARINKAGGVEAFRASKDGIRVSDEEFGGKSTVVYDPRNIRSQFARFDPRLSHLKNLSAGIAGGIGLMAAQPYCDPYRGAQ